MKAKNEDYKKIPGWGMDADPENEPTYPIKIYTGEDHNRFNYQRSEQQLQHEEILISNERPEITRVFGTSVPPSGFSGMIRRYAFKHSEDRYRHWLPLILADRINVAEGLFADLTSGHLPNLIKERGLGVEWKYNRKTLIKKAALTLAAGFFICVYVRNKHKDS